MENWIKHKKDMMIVSCSRHSVAGKLQGYIVRVITPDYNRVQFKHYQYREVAELSALTDYRLSAHIIECRRV